MLIEIDASKSLKILNSLEQYNPNVNPYMEIKARTLHKLGNDIEALNLMNQAKIMFNEGWKLENQLLLEKLQMIVR